MAHTMPATAASRPPRPVAADITGALDEAAVLQDLLHLLFLAGEGLPGPDGAAVARSALLAKDRLRTLCDALDPEGRP